MGAPDKLRTKILFYTIILLQPAVCQLIPQWMEILVKCFTTNLGSASCCQVIVVLRYQNQNHVKLISCWVVLIISMLVSGAPTGLPGYELRGVQQEGRRRVNKQGDTCGWGWGGDSHLRPAQTFIRI